MYRPVLQPRRSLKRTNRISRNGERNGFNSTNKRQSRSENAHFPSSRQSRTIASSRESQSCTTSEGRFILPAITSKTAGITSISTVSHPGWAKGFAASRSDTGSLVHTLSGPNRTNQKIGYVDEEQRFVGTIPGYQESFILVPHGYEDTHYTDLENLKKKRLREAYLDALENHKKKRSSIIKRHLQTADKVKQQNYLHADHATSTLFGWRGSQPVQIPTGRSKATRNEEEEMRPRTMIAMKQAWENISSSYFNVWNRKLQVNTREA